MIQVKVDITGALKFLKVHLPRDVDSAAARALTRTAASARKSAVATIKEQTSLPPKFIRDRLKIRGATGNNLTATITAMPGAPNLARYTARQTKQGVTAKAWKQRKLYRGAFIGNKGRTVFTRVGEARLPIKPLYGPSVRRTFMQDVAQQAMREAIEREFPKHFQSALAGILARRGYRP